MCPDFFGLTSLKHIICFYTYYSKFDDLHPASTRACAFTFVPLLAFAHTNATFFSSLLMQHYPFHSGLRRSFGFFDQAKHVQTAPTRAEGDHDFMP